MIILKVTYRIPVHYTAEFERILVDQVIPLAKELGIDSKGVWKTLVGNVGEYLEIWSFDSVADFELKWKKLLNHPEMQKTFQVTGSMVMDESFSLLEPIASPG